MVWNQIDLPVQIDKILRTNSDAQLAGSRADIIDIACGGPDSNQCEVAYEVPGKGRVVEATVVRCRNGIAVNYPDIYMRRRDPDCMIIADDQPTDKERFADRYPNLSFDNLQNEVLNWLASQPLTLLPFYCGRSGLNKRGLLVAPRNAAFFVGGLADLQEPLVFEPGELYRPQVIIYVAPPFRHTHFDGKQVVVHKRTPELHEIYAFNLYPGPSAKKGVYGALLTLGEAENWVTLHGSTVQVVTPYDNIFTVMHEGASGSGKSEMLEYPHREPDGQLKLGTNLITGESRYVSIGVGCSLRPVTDDMALALPQPPEQRGGKLVVQDAENAWFVRVNHITRYGVDPHLESICAHPDLPMIFLNMQGVPRATCLLWEHIEDAPGVRCPNPRVILPRTLVPGVVDRPVEVDLRSFGVRTPPCTAENPSYGIMGMLHVLPPALAWLWRLIAPRGHANPSITEDKGLASEGVGSYWPFATGRRVVHANLLLEQILQTPKTRYTLSPNQHIGAWDVGFMPQWIVREYLARRGSANFNEGQLKPARCPLLGYVPRYMRVEGANIPNIFLAVEIQPEVGLDGYDRGADLLRDFFVQELEPYLDEDDLHPLGRRIIKHVIGGPYLETLENLI